MNYESPPRFKSVGELSKLTGISTRRLYQISKLPERQYKTVYIPKKSGGLREISIPSETLLKAQKWILENILDTLTPTEHAMAFRKGSEYGIKKNALTHLDSRYALIMDLKDFFPSINSRKVFKIFSGLKYGKFESQMLTNLCTLNGKLPQGGACSPALSNLVCRPLDAWLSTLCQKWGVKYTRYADDMCFSCDNHSTLTALYADILEIIKNFGFKVNPKKTRWHTPSNKKQFTGVTVCPNGIHYKKELKAPKHLKLKVREELFLCLVTGDYSDKAHILGEISYISHIEKENARPYFERVKAFIDRQLSKIKYFPELVNMYNFNKFFKDCKDAVSEPVAPQTEEQTAYFRDLYLERKRLLYKKGLYDICDYSKWPTAITSGGKIDGQ